MQQRVVISGGSSGIGLAIVERFVNSGHQVFNLDIQPSSNKTLMHCDVQCDVTDHEVVKACIDEIAKDGNIDVLVCNAGAHMSANIEQTDEASLLRLFNLNVKGAYSLTQASLAHMKSQGGSIIYVASDQAIVAKQNSFAYNLTKHALASMAKTTALDYAAFNIRANAVCPGTIETPLFHSAIERYCASSGQDKASVVADEAKMQPLGRIGQPQEVAAMVAFLASAEASFVTGSLQLIDGGYCAQ
ncbi:SDR family oxidoreductase [Glaciecola siphonariae]|uniref:SDR family oxidoreductase n=1 Tax=Glaciecola siphonariae TaxID=521012 RepID=A0ABV9LSQ9_9ALTE